MQTQMTSSLAPIVSRYDRSPKLARGHLLPCPMPLFISIRRTFSSKRVPYLAFTRARVRVLCAYTGTDCGARQVERLLGADGICQDGGAESAANSCPLGTDCTDCGIRTVSPPGPPSPPLPPQTPGSLCSNTCQRLEDLCSDEARDLINHHSHIHTQYIRAI